MLPQTDIRNLYKPLQPTVKLGVSNVEYCEIIPHELLQPVIYCYWELKTNIILDQPFMYRVVADGCIDIFFEADKPSENFVMGFCKQYTEFPLENSFHYIGIRFLPTMFPQVFKIDASTLSNKFQELNNVIPQTAFFLSKNFQEKYSDKDIKQILDEYFIALINNSHFDNDPRFYDAIDIILQNNGLINIEKDIDTGLSPRQLRRIFKYYIGDTAKTFSQVVRFQNILKAKPSLQSLKKNKLFFDAGYYDQTHFIKEFKNFYGVTPSKAFGR